MHQKYPFYHPWHSIESGPNIPQVVNAIIEIPQGSKAKYELDKKTGFLRLDRILTSQVRYPFHYGFIPQTYEEDKDPLDILVICSEALFPLSIVEARVIGSVKMVDQGEQDDKIIAVAHHDPSLQHITSLADVDPSLLKKIKTFFLEYKKPEGKSVVIDELIDAHHAQELITQSTKRYKEVFNT